MIENLQIIDPSILDHLMFIFLAIILPVMGIISSKGIEDFHFDRETKLNLYYSNGFFLWILALIVISLWNFGERSFDRLGFSYPEWNSVVLILTSAFILLYIIELLSKRLFLRWERRMDWLKNLQFLPDSFGEFKHYLFLVFAAGICEEILFRGFLIHYIYSFFPNSYFGLWLGISLPAIVFAVGHFYQGPWAVAKILLGAMLLSIIYLLSGSLYVVILLHLGVDIFSAIFARVLINQSNLQEEVDIDFEKKKL